MRAATAVLSTLFVTLFALDVRAQALGPEELVRKVTADVLESVKSDKDLLADRKRALALAEQKVLPHVDFREAAQLAVGKAWWAATPAQRERIVTEFRGLLIRIYSNALDTYRGQTMQVLPVRMAPGATETTVRNRYLKPGAPPVPVEYAMKKTPEGWKIYDIVVEGVSLVLTYRSEFEQITRASGIDGLIKRLAEKNA
ncbi:MAG: MlaC/ttg2D family ABC transporter substrate-binding protein [Betaproteobacteria bacterium]